MSNPAPGFAKHPNYDVTIAPVDQPVQVKVGETLVAQSANAVLLKETRHRPVWYLPTEDLIETVLVDSDTRTYCPFKGYASYWHIKTANGLIEDAIWTYKEPFDECLPIASYASFYTNKVELFIDGELAGSQGPGWIED